MTQIPSPSPSPSPSPPADPDRPTSQNPSPSPGGADPSESSPTASSAAADGFVADPGPAFDPEHAPDVDHLADEDLEQLQQLAEETWDESTIRELLEHQGRWTHAALRVRAVDDDHTWKHTQDDLRAIAPPLTRLLNRYDVSRALAAHGSDLSLIAGVGTYVTRNYTERRRLLAIARAIGEAPVSGRAAEPGTGPPEDQDVPGPEVPPEHLGPPPAIRPKGPHAR